MMIAQPHTKFVEDRPYASPEAAARKLLEIAEDQVMESGLPHSYTGVWNTAFTRSGGSVREYKLGRDFGILQGWFSIDESGSRITPKVASESV